MKAVNSISSDDRRPLYIKAINAINEMVETGRMITVGEYSGIKGFRNVYGNMEVEFKNDKEAARVLELVRYANVHTQKPLTKHELFFVAQDQFSVGTDIDNDLGLL